MNRLMIFCFMVMSIFAFPGCRATGAGSVTINNMYPDSISSVGIKVCGQDLTTNSIPPSGHATLLYKVKFDSDYDVTVTFANGKTEKKQLGYVMSGFCFIDTIFVSPDSIYISPHSILKRKCKES